MNYTSNKSKRGNTTDRKSQVGMKPSQSVLNMLVQKDKILADQYRSGRSVSPTPDKRQFTEEDTIEKLPLMRRAEYVPEDITTAEVLTRVSKKDQVPIIGQGPHYALLKNEKASIDLKARL